LKIEYKNKKIEKLCTQRNLAVRRIGRSSAVKLANRVSDLLAADSLKDVIVGGGHELTGDRKGEYALKLGGGMRLCMTAQSPVPKKSDGSTDWDSVRAVTLVFIGNYHD